MLALAWRNIWRKRWRSVFTVVAVVMVVLLSTVQLGLMGALKNGLYENLTSQAGHLQVRTEGWRDIRDFSDLLVRDAGRLVDEIGRTVPEAELVGVLEVGGLLEGDGRSRGILLQGVRQPAEARQEFGDRYLIEGALPEPGDLEGIALGRRLAEALEVTVGDTVYLYAPGTEGYGAGAYTVSGLLSVPGSEALAYSSLAAAQELAAPDAVSRIEIHLPYHRFADDAGLPAVMEELAPLLPAGLALETWAEVNPGIASYIDIMDPTNLVFMAIFYVLAGLVVMNTIYLSIIERVREFGVMMAVGLQRAAMIRMVLLESLLLCGTGATLGFALGAGVVALMAGGFSFPEPLASFYAESGFPTTLYANLSLFAIGATAVFTLLMGLIAASLPAMTAGRLEPVEAMRFTA